MRAGIAYGAARTLACSCEVVRLARNLLRFLCEDLLLTWAIIPRCAPNSLRSPDSLLDLGFRRIRVLLQ